MKFPPQPLVRMLFNKQDLLALQQLFARRELHAHA